MHSICRLLLAETQITYIHCLQNYVSLIDFSMEEGKRLNSLNYTSDGYRYTKYRELNETVYLRCTFAKRCACKGTAKISST